MNAGLNGWKNGASLKLLKLNREAGCYCTSKFDWYGWLEGKKARKYVSPMAQFRESVEYVIWGNPPKDKDETLDELMMWLQNSPESLDHKFKFYQSNHEGGIIDSIHDEKEWADGIIINAGAFTHYSYSIRDAIETVGLPTVEVHISDIKNREDF